MQIFFDLDVGLITDVGVAGIHRIFPFLDKLRQARLLIVVAGMEGALPSVIGGLTGKPILAVPTSVGYGASFNGISALLGMLNSCSGGVSVLNIDNGFGLLTWLPRYSIPLNRKRPLQGSGPHFSFLIVIITTALFLRGLHCFYFFNAPLRFIFNFFSPFGPKS